MFSRVILCGVATAVVALTGSLTASASFPGTNGAIVFQSNRAGGAPELYLQNEDGTGVRRLTFNTATRPHAEVLARRHADRVRE